MELAFLECVKYDLLFQLSCMQFGISLGYHVISHNKSVLAGFGWLVLCLFVFL